MIRNSLLRGFTQIQRLTVMSSTRSASNCAVKFDEFGDPNTVLRLEECDIPKTSDSQVLLKVLAAPINPADINLIQGTYGFKPTLPGACAGLEGVGEIVEVGSGVKGYNQGDWVLLPGDAFGTWRKFGVAEGRRLRKINKSLDVITASTMTVNPPTAYRMLKDFVDLKPGDTVIQNGANSGVGQAVIQIAKAMGVKSVNIVRNRDNIADLKKELKDLGADYVVTEEELRLPEMKDLFKSIPLPKLALNCVGGKNCSDMMRYLANKAYVVTYGAMSKQPVMASATNLIFKDVRVVGFWRTQWAKENMGTPEDDKMYEDLTKMCLDGHFKAPKHVTHNIEDYKKAVADSMKGFTSAKQIFVNK